MSDGPTTWMSAERAASIMGTEVVTLRRALERNARRTSNGVESKVDGVRARKFGRKWKVALDGAWLNPFGR